MKKILLASAVMALLGVTVTMNVLAQPPVGEGRPDGPPPRGEGRPEERPRPPHPVMDALDADHNGEISEEEINNATAALKSLDKNSDGKLTDDEIRPPRPEGGPGRDGERRPDGPPRGEGEPRGDRPPGDRPPGDRPPRDGEGRPPRDGEGRPPGDGRGPRDGEGRPPEGRDQGRGREQGRGDGPPGQGPQGRPMGPPNPERFVEDAMRFDADADGKLSKEELMKFAVEMGNRQGRPPGGEGGRGPRPEGDRPPGDRPPGEGEGQRPERPPVEE
jgi:hypothetical protein